MRRAGGAYSTQRKGSVTSQPTIGAASERQRTREQIMTAMLEASGELGYRRATVRGVIERAGETPSRFYSSFSTKEDCFAAAYEVEAERLYSALIAAAQGQSSWREGMRAALQELFAFVTERPLIARALFKEVYTARGPALVKHEEILERLSRAMNDSARRETSASRHSLPPQTAAFMVGAIEEFVCAQIAARRPERLWAGMPQLMSLLIAPYLGDQAAAEELQRPALRPGTPIG